MGRERRGWARQADRSRSASLLQDYMQNVHGKEIDLLRTTVKVPGKRLPRATTAAAPGASPKANGLAKERSSSQLAGGTGESGCHVPSVCPSVRPLRLQHPPR